jgi:RimJ/RimL family protein N-acetyltransferase
MGLLSPIRATLRDGAVVAIRSAAASDAARVIAASKLIFAQTDLVLTQPDEFVMTAETEEAFLLEQAESRTALFVIAEAAGAQGAAEIVGISNLMAMKRRRAGHCVGLGIMVHEAWRGRGVGDAMMGAMMAWARANEHIRRVQLEVITSNTRAVELYQRHGFVIEGRRVGCFQRVAGVYEDDYIMAAHVV